MAQLNATKNRRRVLAATAIVVTVVAALLLLAAAVSAAPQPAERLVTSEAAAAPMALACDIDSDGANDEAGQKDLTRVCVDYDVANPLHVTWNWDEISITQTADACALFDTNNDGLVNYAVCNQWTGSQVQSGGYPVVYSCDNSKPQNCGGATALTNTATTCSITNTADDPFSAGDSYPNDTLSDCSIDMTDLGGSATFLDVCSYPSASPNSVASDCVYVSSDKGNLNVIKNVVPDDSVHNVITNWNIAVTGPTPFSDSWTGDGSTGVRAVNPGTYTIVETASAPTVQTDYDTVWSCNLDGGTPATGTGTTISNRVIAKGQVLTCTFTNTRKTGSLQVVKDVVPDATSTWDFAATGPWPFTCQITAGDGSCAAQTVATGSYSIAETVVAGYDTTWACTGGASGTSGTGVTATVVVNQGNTVVCTFTNTKRGTITVDKVTNPTGAGHVFDFSLAGGPDSLNQSFTLQDQATPASHQVKPGTYSVTETGDEGWWLEAPTGCVDSGTSTPVGTSPPLPGTSGNGGSVTDITITAGQTIVCTFTNKVGPTAVTLASFSAAGQASGVQIDWETAQETQNQGFHLWRGTTPAGPDVRLNAAIIPSQNPGGTMGASYQYVDTYQLTSGTTYYYWLEDVSLSGAVTRHEPVSVTYNVPTAVRLAGPRAAGNLPLVWPLAGIALLAIGAAALIRRRTA